MRQLSCVLAVGMLSWGGIMVLLNWQWMGSAGVCLIRNGFWSCAPPRSLWFAGQFCLAAAFVRIWESLAGWLRGPSGLNFVVLASAS